MADIQNTPRLDMLRENIREPLRAMLADLKVGLRDNLRSLTVVGSSLTGDYKHGDSDINTVAVLDSLSTEVLNTISSLTKSFHRDRLSVPLLMTPSYIERSRDVFGIELLDFQLIHQTILGDDPFAPLTFEKANVRLQCERELKAMLVRLRQGYIAAGGKWRAVHEVLVATAKGLTPLVRAMLWLHDVERPATMAPALRKASEEFKVNLEAAVAAQQWRFKKPRLTPVDIQNHFAAIFGAVDSLATTIDQLKL